MTDKSDGMLARCLSMVVFALYLPLFAATEVLFLVLVAEFAAVMLISTPFICMAVGSDGLHRRHDMFRCHMCLSSINSF